MNLLVPDDSPLRNPPRSLDPRQKVAFDGIRYALDMGFLSYQRLLIELHKIGLAHRAGKKHSVFATQALADAWSFVDTVWRLKLLLERMPGLKRTPGLEANLRAFKAIQELRNAFQHLDGQLYLAVNMGVPLWGTLSWFWAPDDLSRGGVTMALVAGSLHSGEQRLVNPLGRVCETPAGLVMLTAFGRELDLSDLAARLPKIARALDLAVREACSTLVPGGADLLIGVEIAFDNDLAAPAQPQSRSPSARVSKSAAMSVGSTRRGSWLRT